MLEPPEVRQALVGDAVAFRQVEGLDRAQVQEVMEVAVVEIGSKVEPTYDLSPDTEVTPPSHQFVSSICQSIRQPSRSSHQAVRRWLTITSASGEQQCRESDDQERDQPAGASGAARADPRSANARRGVTGETCGRPR